MGGLRSGRQGMQTTTEDCKQIDIRSLRKEGCLGLEHQGTIHWSSRGEPNGWIEYSMRADRMILMFRFRDGADADWQDMDQTIFIDQTPCHFGGFRKWFLCPNCKSRVGVLYGRDILFLCRKCYQLPYRSTLQTKIERLWSKKYKLGNEIYEYFEYGEGSIKKKGMHQKTFNEKLIEYRSVDRQIEKLYFLKTN